MIFHVSALCVSTPVPASFSPDVPAVEPLNPEYSETAFQAASTILVGSAISLYIKRSAYANPTGPVNGCTPTKTLAKRFGKVLRTRAKEIGAKTALPSPPCGIPWSAPTGAPTPIPKSSFKLLEISCVCWFCINMLRFLFILESAIPFIDSFCGMFLPLHFSCSSLVLYLYIFPPMSLFIVYTLFINFLQIKFTLLFC